MTSETDNKVEAAVERLTVEELESLRWIADHQHGDARELINKAIASLDPSAPEPPREWEWDRLNPEIALRASSPSQGGETVDRSGVAAADDNHKALVEIAREIDAEADNISPLNSVHPAGTMRNWATRIRDAAFQSRKEESR